MSDYSAQYHSHWLTTAAVYQLLLTRHPTHAGTAGMVLHSLEYCVSANYNENQSIIALLYY